MKRIWTYRFPWIFATLLTLIYFSLPFIADAITSISTLSKYAGSDAHRIVNYIQSGFIFPFQDILKNPIRAFVIFPYLWVIGIVLTFLWVMFPRFWKIMAWSVVGVWIFLWFFPNTLLLLENDKISRSKGSVSNGIILNSKRLPFNGENFITYSFPLYLAGRTFVHQKVRQTLLDAFEMLESECPETTFVVGETGLRHGGHFPPHRTHRNGLSVDIMSPLLKNGSSTRSHHLFNLWGYGLEFNNQGKKGKIAIDYETFAHLLNAIKKSAAKNGLEIQKVIFDPVLRPYLLKTKAGKQIQNLPFTKNRVIIRHDDHVHIDFKLK